MSERLVRAVGAAGLLFVVLVVAAGFVAPSSPSPNAAAAKVLTYFHDHKSAVQVQAYVIGLSVFVGVVFFWHLRDLLSTDGDSRRWATIGFAGALMFAMSGVLSAGAQWASAQGVGHLDASTMQGLNYFQMYGVGFVAGIGEALLLIGMGLAVVRGAALPRWLGWVGVILGIAALALPMALGPLPGGAWALVVAIVVLVRASSLASERAFTAGRAA